MRPLIIVALAASATLATTLAAAQLLPSPEGERFAFETELSGEQEVPPVQASGSGSLQIHFDDALSEAAYRIDLTATTATAAHLHCAVAGENGPVVVTLLLSGASSLDRIITNADIDQAAGAAEACGIPINNVASLLAAIRRDRIYVNVHTEGNPAGELRGQIFPDGTRTQSQAGPSIP